MDIEARYHDLKIQFVQVIQDLLAHGKWDDTILREAEVECHLPAGYAQVIFPEGIEEIIDFLERHNDEKMLKILSSYELPVKIRDKIALALKVRIKDCLPKLGHLQNSIYFAIPSNMMFAMKAAFRTCDLIWRYANDKSIDYNYYTKRSLLSGVYISSIIYYIQDKSENNIKTDEYIAESLSDVIKVTSKLKDVFKLPKAADIPIIRLFS